MYDCIAILGRMMLILVLVGLHMSTGEIAKDNYISDIILLEGPLETETKRFLYNDPSQKDVVNHCRFCEPKALADSTYVYMQNPLCFHPYVKPSDQPIEWEKSLTPYEWENQKFPICNVGEVPGCGPPSFIRSNSYWKCDPGYSNTNYSVYFSCALICNITGKMLAGVYCNESLQWDVYKEPTEACHKHDKVDLDLGGNLVYVGIGVILLIAVIAFVAVIAAIWYRRSSGKDAELADNTEPLVGRPQTMLGGELRSIRTSTKSSIGSCSISPDTGISGSGSEENINTSVTEKIPLLPMSKEADNGEGTDSGAETSFATNEEINPNVSAATNGPSDVDSNEKKNMCRRKDLAVASQNRNHVSVGTGTSDNVTVPGTNDRHISDNNSSDSNHANNATDTCTIKESPCVKIFHLEGKTRCSSTKTSVIQDGVYSVPKGSSFCVVPSSPNGKAITEFLVKRKGEGRPYRGEPLSELNLNFFHHVSSADLEDEGLYSWTISLENGEIFDGSFEIFVSEQGVDEECQRPLGERMEPIGADSDTCKVAQTNPQINHVVVDGCRTTSETQTSQNTAQPPGVHQDSHLQSETIDDMNNLSESRENLHDNCAHDLNNLTPRNLPESEIDFHNMNIKSLTENSSIDSNSLQHNFVEKNANSVQVRGETPLSLPSVANAQSNLNQPIQNDTTSVNLDNKEIAGSGKLDSETLADKNKSKSSPERQIEQRDEHLSVSLGHALKNVVTLNPDTINYEIPSCERLEPSGISTDCTHVESRPSTFSEDYFDERHNTSLKEVVESVGGVGNPLTPANGREPIQPDVNPNTDANGHTNHPAGVNNEHVAAGPGLSIGSPRINSIRQMDIDGNSLPQRPEVNHVPLAVGQIPGSVAGSPDKGSQATDIQIQEAVQCKTKLRDVKDTYFKEKLGNLADPRHHYNNTGSWYGLGEFYKIDEYILLAIEYHFKGCLNEGPMISGVFHILKQKDYSLGHVVLYFTRPMSVRRDIVDLCVLKCDDHNDCQYCTELKRKMPLNISS